MTTLLKTLGALVLCSSLLGGCAGKSATAANAAATPAAGAVAGSNLGLSDQLIQVAVKAAKDYLANKMGAAQGTTATAEDKAAAAAAGAQAAAVKAKEDGKEITEEQRTGLTDMLKGML